MCQKKSENNSIFFLSQKKTYKTKVADTPNLVAVGQVRLGVRPHPGVRQPIQVQGEGLLPWSPGRSGQNLAVLLPTWP